MTLKQEVKTLTEIKNKQKEGELALLVPERTHLRDVFMFSHKKGYLRLAKEGLQGADYDVLMVCLGLLNKKNYIQVSQQEIADYLGMNRQNVSRSTKKLVDKKILLEGEKIGRNKTYILNSFFGWKGKINEDYYKSYTNHSEMFEDEGIA